MKRYSFKESVVSKRSLSAELCPPSERHAGIDA